MVAHGSLDVSKSHAFCWSIRRDRPCWMGIGRMALPKELLHSLYDNTTMLFEKICKSGRLRLDWLDPLKQSTFLIILHSSVLKGSSFSSESFIRKSCQCLSMSVNVPCQSPAEPNSHCSMCSSIPVSRCSWGAADPACVVLTVSLCSERSESEISAFQRTKMQYNKCTYNKFRKMYLIYSINIIWI